MSGRGASDQVPAFQGDPCAFSRPLDPPLEDLDAPTWLVDRKGAIIGANRSARELEVRAGRTLPLSTPSSHELLDEGSELRRACEDGRSLEVCVRGHDTACTRKLALEPLRDISGSPSGALLVVTDAGNVRRARSFYARILTAAARELQSPLASLRHHWALARRATGDGDPGRVPLYLDRAELHARRLEYLVGELRDLVEGLSGTTRIQPVALDLAAEVRIVIDGLAPSTRNHVFVTAGPAEAVVVVDPERIRRVLCALLSNAVRFNPGGGRISVEIKLAGQEAILAVADDGPGVPEERLRDLFNGPCWDSEAASGGLGLGLYLAREAVELHGGTIHAERITGGGTRVVVALPRLQRGTA